MAEFKIGDKVVRKENFRYGVWELNCARNDKATDGIFQVEGLRPLTGRITIGGLPGAWDESSFHLATVLEEHQGTGLSAEDLLRESDAHIECLRDLLDIERRRVSELQAEVSRCCGTVADKSVLEDKIAKLLKLNNELADQVDAATTAAKSLGDEVANLRRERRALRLTFHSLDGNVHALDSALADIDFGMLRTQLDLISRMADEQGNGADAKLCANAYQVIDMLDEFLTGWRGQDE